MCSRISTKIDTNGKSESQPLPPVFCPARANGFMDVLDAQWECEGELIPLALSDLNPRECLVYQHGLFLMEAMNRLTLVSAKVYHLRSV